MLDGRLGRALGGQGRLLDLEVLLRGGGEVAVLNSRGGRSGWSGRGRGSLRRGGAAPDHLLGLGGVVADILLGDLSGTGGVGAGGLAKLLSLGVNDLLGVLKVVVDKLLVGSVDQRGGEDDGGADERETPVRDDLNEPVREECADADLAGGTNVSPSQETTCVEVAWWVPGYTYSQRSPDVLGEDDALSLDDEEVNQLMNIADQDVKGLARNGVVTTRPELTGNTSVHDSLPGGLSGNGNAQDHPGELEAPSDHIQVPNREDEGDDRGIGDRGGACRALSVPESCL